MVDHTRNEHGHWGYWPLDPGRDRYNASLWIDQGVLMLRAVDKEHGDPIELNTHEALEVAICILERVRAIDVEEGEGGDEEAWARVARIASPSDA